MSAKGMGLAAVLASGLLTAGDGDVHIGNQAPETEYLLSPEEALPAGESIVVTYLDTPVPERKATAVRLSEPGHWASIRSGETATLSWNPPAGPGPHRRCLRLAEAGGVDIFRIEYRVKRVDGRAVGEVEAVPLVGPVDGPVGAFDRIEGDILVMWGR